MPEPIKCFLSHRWSHGEHRFARELKGKLEDYRGITVLLDEDEMCPGDQIKDWMDSAIQSGCDVFLFVVSPEALKSENCLYELNLAIERELPIIPIYIRDCQVPKSLQGILFADFRDALDLPFHSIDRLVEAVSWQVEKSEARRLTEDYVTKNAAKRWFWYISPQKLANIGSPHNWSFLHQTQAAQSIAPGTPWGKLNDADTVRSSWVEQVTEIENDIRTEFTVVRAGDIQSGQTPVFIEFQGKAGRLILRESYKDEKAGESVFILVGTEGRTGVVLLGSGANVVGANSARPRITDPSGDPVGALLDLVDRNAGVRQDVAGFTRVGIAASRVGVHGLEQCTLYSFAAALHESTQRCFPTNIKTLAVFSGQVRATNLNKIEGLTCSDFAFPDVDRVVIGSPIYVEQIEDTSAA
jgi:hypothetical protein